MDGIRYHLYSYNEHNSGIVDGFGTIKENAKIVSKIKYKGITYEVNSIEKCAFKQCGLLVSLTIPNSVNYISDYAFMGCERLNTINIPDSVTTICEGTFWKCYKLTSIRLPNKLAKIESWAFNNCTSLGSLIIPSNVTYIGDVAFSGCTSLKELMVLAKVPPVLGSRTFKGVDPDIPVYVNDPKIYQGWGGFNNIVEIKEN